MNMPENIFENYEIIPKQMGKPILVRKKKYIKTSVLNKFIS